MANKKATFEEAMEQLEGILAQLGQPDVTLDESIALYAKAAELVKHCNESLAGAEIRIREISEQLEKDGQA